MTRAYPNLVIFYYKASAVNRGENKRPGRSHAHIRYHDCGVAKSLGTFCLEATRAEGPSMQMVEDARRSGHNTITYVCTYVLVR